MSFLKEKLKKELILEPFISCKPSLFNNDTLKDISMTFNSVLVNNWLCRPIIGGPATGAIPIITSLMHLTYHNEKSFYVRKTMKANNSYIDGCVPTCLDRVVLVDDILNTGGSLLFCAQVLREIKVDVKGFIVLIDKELPGTRERLEKIAPLHSIFTLKELL